VKILVKWHRRCRQRFAEWFAAREHIYPDARALLKYYLHTIEEALVKYKGEPPGVKKHETLSPPALVWEVVAGRLWIVYVIEVLRRMLRWHTVLIKVWRVYEEPPDKRTLLLPQL
jgi:hypothetical protein